MSKIIPENKPDKIISERKKKENPDIQKIQEGIERFHVKEGLRKPTRDVTYSILEELEQELYSLNNSQKTEDNPMTLQYVSGLEVSTLKTFYGITERPKLNNQKYNSIFFLDELKSTNDFLSKNYFTENNIKNGWAEAFMLNYKKNLERNLAIARVDIGECIREK